MGGKAEEVEGEARINEGRWLLKPVALCILIELWAPVTARLPSCTYGAHDVYACWQASAQTVTGSGDEWNVVG